MQHVHEIQIWHPCQTANGVWNCTSGCCPTITKKLQSWTINGIWRTDSSVLLNVKSIQLLNQACQVLRKMGIYEQIKIISDKSKHQSCNLVKSTWRMEQKERVILAWDAHSQKKIMLIKNQRMKFPRIHLYIRQYNHYKSVKKKDTIFWEGTYKAT